MVVLVVKERVVDARIGVSVLVDVWTVVVVVEVVGVAAVTVAVFFSRRCQRLGCNDFDKAKAFDLVRMELWVGHRFAVVSC